VNSKSDCWKCVPQYKVTGMRDGPSEPDHLTTPSAGPILVPPTVAIAFDGRHICRHRI